MQYFLVYEGLLCAGKDPAVTQESRKKDMKYENKEDRPIPPGIHIFKLRAKINRRLSRVKGLFQQLSRGNIFVLELLKSAVLSLASDLMRSQSELRQCILYLISQDNKLFCICRQGCLFLLLSEINCHCVLLFTGQRYNYMSKINIFIQLGLYEGLIPQRMAIIISNRINVLYIFHFVVTQAQ